MTLMPDGKPQIRYHEEDREELDYYRRFPFPSGTRGVFYYHQPPDRPPVAGELRFRVCDSVSHFIDGADQKSQWGTSWRSPLYWLVKSDQWQSVLRLLINEGCVRQQLVDDIKQLRWIRTQYPRYLFELDEPFLVSLDNMSLDIDFITRRNVKSVNFKGLFASRKVCPYQGLIKVRFEGSALDEDDGENFKVVLRVLEAVTPIQCIVPGEHLIAEPQPGKLLLRRKSDSQKFKPWTHSTASQKDANSRALKSFFTARMNDLHNELDENRPTSSASE